MPPDRGPKSLVTNRSGLETGGSNQRLITNFHVRARAGRTMRDMGARLASPKPQSQPHNTRKAVSSDLFKRCERQIAEVGLIRYRQEL
jgi:hypothetical protein